MSIGSFTTIMVAGYSTISMGEHNKGPGPVWVSASSIISQYVETGHAGDAKYLVGATITCDNLPNDPDPYTPVTMPHTITFDWSQAVVFS